MFQFIRRHQAIGLIFIGIVIVSFVIFFSPNQGAGRASMPRGALGAIRGRPIERDEYLGAVKEARLSHMLREGTWPGRGGRDWDEQRQVLDRLLLLDEAERLGIQVTDDVAAGRIVGLQFLSDERTKAFSKAAYAQFLEMIGREEGITRADFERFMRHEVALQHLVQLAGLSGALVPPREAEARYRAANEQFGALLAVFSGSNYLAQVNLDPTNITQHYSNRLAEYRIPERVQVRFVEFAATNFLAEAETQLNTNTNLAFALENAYQQRGPETFQDEQGNVKPPEAAKEELKEQFRHSLALDTARKKANEFANRLYKLDPSPDSLTQLAGELAVEVKVSPPFDQFRPPPGMNVPSTFNRAAFALSQAEPFATPLVGQDAVFVYAFERRVPSEVLPLESVRDRVIESWRRTGSRQLAEAEGRRFATAATNALVEGKSFEAAAAEAGVSVVTVTNFSRSTTMVRELGSRLTISELLRAAADLKTGSVSPFVPAADGGFVMNLTARNPVSDEELARELPKFLEQARQFGRFSSFVEWERKRFANADVRTPGGGGATNTAATVSN